jgi:hypothetical protein
MAESLELRALGRTDAAGACAAWERCGTFLPRSTARRISPGPRGRADPSDAGLAVVRRPFFLCPSCDRGETYYGLPCRRGGHARSLRAAGRRDQQSPRGASITAIVSGPTQPGARRA